MTTAEAYILMVENRFSSIDEVENPSEDDYEVLVRAWNNEVDTIETILGANPENSGAYEKARRLGEIVRKFRDMRKPEWATEAKAQTPYLQIRLRNRILGYMEEATKWGPVEVPSLDLPGSWPRINAWIKDWNKGIKAMEKAVLTCEWNLVSQWDKENIHGVLEKSTDYKVWLQGLYDKFCHEAPLDYPEDNVSLKLEIMNEKYKGKKNLLLIIDAQIDFVEVGRPLFIVNGATTGMKNLCKFININRDLITDITLTRDDHYNTHIGMPHAWLEGSPRHIIDNYPKPITKAEVEKGIYEPRFIPKAKALEYLEKIEARGERHMIWPEHCLHGDFGQQFPEELMLSLKWWSEDHGGRHYKIIDKGSRDDAEMYSAFSYADGSMPEYTQAQLDDIAKEYYDNIFVAGFAKDYCVRCTLEDFLEDSRFREKLVILDSCMASINTQDNKTKELWATLENEFGAEIIK